jgi:hypothetical protein
MDPETHVTFLAAGRTVVKNGEIGDMMIRDIASVILYAFGIEDPDSFLGRVPSGLFEGVTATERKTFEIPKLTDPIRGHETVATPEIGSGDSVLDALGAERVEAYFDFDHNVDDRTGHYVTGSGGKIYFVDGWFGDAADLLEGYVTMADFYPGTESFSVGFFMNTPGVSTDPPVFSNKRMASAVNPCFGFFMNIETLRLNVGNKKTGNVKDGYDLPADFRNGWVYVLLQVDRENNRWSVSYDWKEPEEWFAFGEEFRDLSFDAMATTCIGQDGTEKYSRPLDAKVDEFIVVKGTLSSGDLAALRAVYMGE